MNAKLKILCSFVIFLFVGSLFMNGVNAYKMLNSTDTDQMTTAETYGDDRRHEAVNILIYSELADMSASGEYRHALDSLIGSLEGRFTYENLTHYNQLGSKIDEFDVLLIVECELSNATFSNMVNSAWSGILPGFVADGGIVICMAYGPIADRTVTAKIINGTLMDIYNYELSTGHQIDLFDANDALARNVPASYTGPDGSISYDIPDAVKVMEDNTNAKAVVAHKTMGKGHVVLLGFDMFVVNAVSDTLLMNAVLLHRHIIFDNSHTQQFSITGDFSDIANDLPYYGFSVSTTNIFSADVFDSCDIFVVTYANTVYNATEIAMIHDFVNNGGALFVTTEWGSYGDEIDGLINAFGFTRNETASLQDSDDNTGTSTYARYARPENLEMHSINFESDVIETYVGTGFISIPANAVPIVITDTDGTTTWGGVENATGIPVAAANLVGAGRIFVLGDTALFRNTDLDSDGTSAYTDSDNEYFLRNAFRWLSGAGIPEQTIVYDQSHNPWSYIYSGWIALAHFMMFNGYNIEYMNTFDPVHYADADILFICDGSTSYNTSEIAWIEEYVADGGGLLLWGNYGSLITEVDPIAQEFNLHANITHSLRDTDDTVGPTGYIVYEGSNIGNHPIMDGVNRVEVYVSGGFNSIGAGTALFTTDNDGTATWSDGSPADDVAVMAVTTYNMGRVAFFTDIDIGLDNDADGDGFGTLYDSDNPVFIANTLKWLAANRAPTVEVITPNGGEVLNGTITAEWNALDFDSDPLTFDILYSDDNGSTWLDLAIGLSGTSYAWNTTNYADGIGYMIRVVVSDGVATASDDSDNPFELDNFEDTIPGGILDPTLLIIIAAAGVVIVIIIIIFLKKKK